MGDGVGALFRWQASACAELGSGFYAELLVRLADDADGGGPTARLLEGHEDDPVDSLLALRLLGGVHRRVLSGLEPRLAVHYPSAGGDGDAGAAAAPLLVVLDGHADELRASLGRPPQTNEVGRAATLVGALWHLQATRPLPVRLLELGASGGLNLLADRFRFEGVNATGPVGSPVVFEDAWRGSVPETGPLLEVVERLGCDRDPVDAATDGGALTLMSYVWPDQPERLARLRGALAVARETPVTVSREGAGDFLATLSPAPGAWTVVWHSVMWQYLDDAERASVLVQLERAGTDAGDDAPLAHVAFEPRRLGPGGELAFYVTLRTWPPAGSDGTLGHAPPHGVPVEWL
jgi:hypothetical protein